MERYTLASFYSTEESPAQAFKSDLSTYINNFGMTMGLTSLQLDETIGFIASAVYGYFYNDLIAYPMSVGEDFTIFLHRISYDISVKLPYWYKKYNQIKKLLTTDELSLLQTSKVTSSSQDTTNSASGSLQKTATTPTGVATGTTIDSIDISRSLDTQKEGTTEITTDGFADKYTNAQQKFANASNIKGERSGNILREGSIEDLLNVLEKLPSSFADEITRELGKHFIFDYEGEERGYYDETI